ncbi:hypothetical protein DFH06DRAFT_1479123 [Mycena polygramma]|nr:hypothetical protein DFH06DRAFT_1479123 [Mycena polygramma]
MRSLRHPNPSLLPVALAFLLPTFIRASALTNLTIDDTNTTYFTFTNDDANPPRWAAITPTDPCVYCAARPKTDRIHNQTWHDGSVGSVGSFSFQGSAVYIYGIDLVEPANISFTLGDNATFHYYNGTEQFVFDALLFAAFGLEDGANHTVSWVLDKSATNGTTALFDYAAVTVEEGAASSSVPSEAAASSKPKSHTGTIVSAVVGVIGGLALLGGLIFLLLRRRRRNKTRESYLAPTPITADEPARAQRVRGNYVVQPTPDTGATEPSFVTSEMVSTGAGRRTEKMVDASESTTSAAPTSPSTERSTIAPTAATATTSPSTRERFLEARLAQLEAHVQQHLPPPYQAPAEV